MERLATLDRRDATLVLSRLGAVSGFSESDLLLLLDQVPEILGRFSDEFTLEYRGEAITWHGYEHVVWSMGEACRHILKRQRSLRHSAALWQRVEALCLDPRVGKGRQSFTMLLGQYGGAERVPTLLKLLDDPQVHGHALHALRRLGAPDGVDHAKRLLESPSAWVRGEARKYLAKVEGQRRGPSA